MLRIGFDAKRFFFNSTGLGNYSRNLLGSLALLAPENEYLLYSPKAPERLPEVAENLSIRLPEGLMGRKLPSLWRRKYICRQLKRDGLDLYHGLSHELPLGIEHTGIRTVVSMHDLIFLRYPHQYPWLDRISYTAKFQHACRVADQIVAISQQTRQDLIDFFNISPERIRVIYQQCDPRFYNPVTKSERQRLRQQHGLPDTYILYVGSIIERKNLLGLVQAWSSLPKGSRPFLVVVGKGKAYEQKVREELARQQLADACLFLPQLPTSDLPGLYQMASALVYPSVFEGFGLPILEALESKTPVITSQGSCFAETGGDAARYADPLSPDSLRQALLEVLEDQDLRAAMVAKGKQHAQAFRPERLVPQWMEVYGG
jgi:glycosyltransferase involved in cell wall biosynthesis